MFLCDKCGICCRQVGNSPFGKNLALESGICKYLNQKTNLCDIYENRPVICNVDKYYDLCLSEVMTREECYKINRNICKILKQNLKKNNL